MFAALVILFIFLAETFVTGFCLARMRALSDELDVLRGVVQTCGVQGGPSVAESVKLDVSTETAGE